jgi:hypothetical protein
MLDLERLLVDLHNPRYNPLKTQRESLRAIAVHKKNRVVNLAEDIVEKGFNPSEVLMVEPAENDPEHFIALEGNRRVAALKLLASDSLTESLNLPETIKRKFAVLRSDARGRIPRSVPCIIIPRAEANYWIHLKHTGQNDGVGVVDWDGPAKHRFRGNSPALQAVDIVRETDYIDAQTKNNLDGMSITNVERLLNTPEVRDLLGVEVKDRRLTLKGPDEKVLPRLAHIIADVANKRIKVSDIDNKDQRVAYAKDVAARKVPPHVPAKTSPEPRGKMEKTPRRIGTERTTLIPRGLKLTIPQPRINKIYSELQTLKVAKYENCSAVMLRVFLDLSVHHFANAKGIDLKEPPRPGSKSPPREIPFRNQVLAVVEYMVSNKIRDRSELRGTTTMVNKRNDVLSIDSLHAYVHNKDFSPSASDLKKAWDNLQPFVEGLWVP